MMGRVSQPVLDLLPAEACSVGPSAGLLEGPDGGVVFVFGLATFAYAAGDETGRRLAAVQLAATKIASAVEVASAFGVSVATLWRWTAAVSQGGVVGLVRERPGPKGPSKLTGPLVARIVALEATGLTLLQIAAAADVSTATVRVALGRVAPRGQEPTRPVGLVQDGVVDTVDHDESRDVARAGELVVLAAPAPRTADRVAARFGNLAEAPVVVTEGAHLPLAGLLLGLPALEMTGLLDVAAETFAPMSNGFYGLRASLMTGVVLALLREPRAEGATRIGPADLGRVLGLDRAPEVKTIRRKIAQLAQAGAAGKLQAAIAHHHLSRGGYVGVAAGVVLYVDGHVRAYQGTKRIGKTHLSRLRFPAPATVETWVAGGDGGPVLVVMSEPGASLAGELARLLPELRTAVGDDRRVLVGFDRGGWSPALFAHMAAAGFDPLTWRKGTIPDLPAEQFTDVAFVGETGREYTWHLADTVVEVPIDDHGGVFPMRQVTRWDTKKNTPRQVHVLTTRTDLSAAQVIYRMGARWRLENYFRYARMHFDLDSHHCYASADDDAHRLVPNPAKRAAHLDVQAVRARHDRAQGRTDAAMLAARSPAPGTQTILTNPVHDAITADLRAAGADLAAAQQTHKTIPTRVPLGELHPGQQVLDVETKLITHAIGAAAFNTINALARDIRLDTGYARANHEAHTLARHVLTHSGDIDPADGVLTVRLDPMPTARATAAIRELCEHLTATGTRYPGTDLVPRQGDG